MEDNRQLRWVVAIGLSLALHVLIVMMMAGLGCDGSLVEVTDKPSMVRPPELQNSDAPSVPKKADDVATKQLAASETAGRLPEKPAEADAQSFKVYVVKPGDNLSKIAKLDGSTLAELAELNGTDVKTLSKLQVGQRIKVRNGVE
jgi:LysM repeat protein